MSKKLLFIPLLAILLSCGNSPQKDLENTIDTLKYTLKTFEKHSQTCINKDSL